MHLLGILIVGTLGILVNGFFLMLGGRVVKIEGATFGRSCLVALIGGVLGGIASAVLGMIPYLGPILGLVISFLVMAFFAQKFFVTSFGKGALAVLFAMVITILIGVGIVMIFGLGAMMSA